MNVPGTVLLVEADTSVSKNVHAYLEDRGHMVLDAGPAESVHDVTVATHPDVILVDADDTARTAPALLTDMLRDDRTAGIPIVLLGKSANRWSKNLECVEKPLDLDQLVTRVEKNLELHRLRQEVRAIRHKGDAADFIDPLTGLNGARRLRDELAHHTASIKRYGGHLSIVLFDLDRFESTNEQHGRSAGDLVLADVGQRLASDVRNSDIVGRWRADQFMAVLPCTNLDGATFFAERFRQLLCELPVITPDGTRIPVSASFGCVEGTDEVEMVQAAEAAIGAAKRHGRNAVVTSGAPSLFV